jgi:hypothetical protein
VNKTGASHAQHNQAHSDTDNPPDVGNAFVQAATHHALLVFDTPCEVIGDKCLFTALVRTLPYVKFLDDLYLYLAHAFSWDPHGTPK